jgi:hypothetical protein
MSSRKKGSVELMEYMFLTLFVIVIVIAFVLFLSWWQMSQVGAERSRMQMDKALVISKGFASSPLFAREESMLDDGKLTAAMEIADICQRLDEIYGIDWYAVVRMLDGQPDTLCSSSNYPDCNMWEFCRTTATDRISYAVPVNIYRNIGAVFSTGLFGRTYVGTLEVGVYI